ncbi:MAG: MBL fold metallo-hydrolase [Thiothrix sp.]|uniref:MBL fold metallo-hydrolase n=1 Tax=Thiothrix sp. TaxID=1032 RepID=UPI00262636F6|nr:MBL fold metallo-hydrolase [Thiothrix sp.]MDD5395568.1 MBL fold metallo-hydrolase [Thiothrix sp.]
MEICIHRGAHQIGGTCVEIAHDGSRIAVDLGLPLDAESNGPELLPAVSGFAQPAKDLLGIIISHPHQDHYGLLAHVPEDLPIAMGQAARNILEAASRFMPGPKPFLGSLELRDRRVLELGPFAITPFTVDHSAYDAYALLIEAGGKRVFYSGDFRAHGRKATLFEHLVSAPPTPVDCLMLEGTSLARLDEGEHFVAESDLEQQFVDAFKRITGLAMVFASAQNIDRLVTMYRAALKSKRLMILDLYTAEILAATGNEKLPQGHWDNVRVIIPYSQSRQATETENLFKRHHCINWATLHELGPKAVMLCRPSMLRQLAGTGSLAGAEVIYSMWDGYLKDGKTQAQLDALNIPMTKIHTSGHADIPTLKRLVAALQPKSVVPIHSEHPELFGALFPNVIARGDGEWWEL